jgi:L-histidine Nalpha-methyltransferase
MPIAVSTSTEIHVNPQVALAVRTGLSRSSKWLPPWLFYDEAGSRLFDQITTLPEYYLTRTERWILNRHAGQMIELAANGLPLRIAELGAGSAEKTGLLLAAALERQQSLTYEPVDVSSSALVTAQARIERGMPGVRVVPIEMDYTNGFRLDPTAHGERRLIIYIGSSIGNFDPEDVARLLGKFRTQLRDGDCLLVGVDLVKDTSLLLAAYNDRAGTTAAFNRNILFRLNRELGADFDPDAFVHRAIWNEARARIEMHLVSQRPHEVHLAALDWVIRFEFGESIHTENSYKYAPGGAEALLSDAGFSLAGCWMDPRRWFSVCLARAV